MKKCFLGVVLAGLFGTAAGADQTDLDRDSFVYIDTMVNEVDHTHQEAYPDMDTCDEGLGAGIGLMFNRYIGFEGYLSFRGEYRLNPEMDFLEREEELASHVLRGVFELPIADSNFTPFGKLGIGTMISLVIEDLGGGQLERRNDNTLYNAEIGFAYDFPLVESLEFIVNAGVMRYKTSPDNISIFSASRGRDGYNRLQYLGIGTQYTW